MINSRVWPALAPGAVILMLTLSACSDDGDASPLPDNPHIRGVISDKSEGTGDVLGTVLIEGVIEEDTTYDKASVRVEGDTDIFQEEQDGTLTEGTFADLAEGQAVEAWFTGPVAESYPVQAKAAKIVILADAPAQPSPTP